MFFGHSRRIISSGNSESCSITLSIVQVSPSFLCSLQGDILTTPVPATSKFTALNANGPKNEQAGDGIIGGRSVWRSGVY